MLFSFLLSPLPSQTPFISGPNLQVSDPPNPFPEPGFPIPLPFPWAVFHFHFFCLPSPTFVTRYFSVSPIFSPQIFEEVRGGGLSFSFFLPSSVNFIMEVSSSQVKYPIFFFPSSPSPPGVPTLRRSSS